MSSPKGILRRIAHRKKKDHCFLAEMDGLFDEGWVYMCVFVVVSRYKRWRKVEGMCYVP